MRRVTTLRPTHLRTAVSTAVEVDLDFAILVASEDKLVFADRSNHVIAWGRNFGFVPDEDPCLPEDPFKF